jgi:O-antigen/teichoic acid export membrane protein
MFRTAMPQWTATAYVGLVSLAVSVAVGRAVGPAGFGEYGMAMAAGSILAIFIDGGMSNLLRRETTRPGTTLGHVVGRLPAVSLGHAFTVALIGALLAVSFAGGQWPLALATVGCFLGTVLVGHVSALVRGQGRWAADAGWQVSQRTLSAAMILGSLAIGLTAPWQVMAAWAAASLIAFLVLPSPLRCRPEFGLKTEVYKITAPLVLIDLATAVYFRSDMLVLGWFDVPQQEVGQYAAAYRLFEAVIMVSGPVGLLLFRRMRLFQGDTKVFRRSLILYVAAAAALGIAVALVMHAAADLLVGWSYGSSYPESAGLLRVICWGLVFVLPNMVLTQAALALERDRAYMWAAVLAALTNVAMNCALVPQLGIVAAAYITLATELVLFIYLAASLLGQRSPVSSKKIIP